MTPAQRLQYEKERGKLALLNNVTDLPNEQDPAAMSILDTEAFDAEMNEAPSDAGEAEEIV